MTEWIGFIILALFAFWILRKELFHESAEVWYLCFLIVMLVWDMFQLEKVLFKIPKRGKECRYL